MKKLNAHLSQINESFSGFHSTSLNQNISIKTTAMGSIEENKKKILQSAKKPTRAHNFQRRADEEAECASFSDQRKFFLGVGGRWALLEGVEGYRWDLKIVSGSNLGIIVTCKDLEGYWGSWRWHLKSKVRGYCYMQEVESYQELALLQGLEGYPWGWR